MKQYILSGGITTLVVILMIMSAQYWHTNEAAESHDQVQRVALDAGAAELRGFMFGTMVTKFVSMTNEQRARELYEYLSEDAQAALRSDELVTDMWELLGTEDIRPGSEAHITNVAVLEPEERAVVEVAFQFMDFADSVRHRYTMIAEDDRWQLHEIAVERPVRQRDIAPPPPPQNPPPTPPEPSPGSPGPSEEEETDPTVRTCYVSGCSSQICSDRPPGDVVTTCEWRQEYACYQDATCERQEDGSCGWTKTSELQECLATAGTGPQQ